MRISVGIALLTFASVLAGCESIGPSSSPSAPSQIPQAAPSPAPQPRPVELAVFTDSKTELSASDVYDVQGQIVRFNTADELIWVANDARFPEFIVDGNFVAYHHKTDKFFQVRFGTKDGERRAYLSWPDDRLTIVDLWVDERGDLKIAETSLPVPGTFPPGLTSLQSAPCAAREAWDCLPDFQLSHFCRAFLALRPHLRRLSPRRIEAFNTHRGTSL